MATRLGAAPAGAAPTPVDAAALRRTFRQVPAATFVVTTSDRGRPVGITLTSMRSLSADPALIGFSVTRTASTWPAFARAGQVLVHVLDGRHGDLAQRFAISGVDRFADPVRHVLDADGLPQLVGPPVVLRCAVQERVGTGDADLFVAALLEVRDTDGDRPAGVGPLLHHAGTFRNLRPYLAEGLP